MATVPQVLGIARSQVGTVERPKNSNRTKYGVWYGTDGVAWCAIFVSWVQNEAGVTVPKFSYTPTGANWFRSKGLWVADRTAGQPGMVAFFDFPGDGVNRISHVGFVIERRGTSYYTVEGNTMPGAKGSQREGGGVYERIRSRAVIVGFGVLPLDQASPPGPRILRQGDVGNDVLQLQRDLNRAGSAGLAEDGDFGAGTLAALKRFQQAHKLTPDGEAGPQTYAKLAEALRSQQPEPTIKEELLVTPPGGILRVGNKSGHVRELQKALNQVAAAGLNADGDYGPATEAAVRRFQIAHSLVVDGEVGPKTYGALNALLARS